MDPATPPSDRADSAAAGNATHELRERLRLLQAMIDESGHLARVGAWSIDPKTGLGLWTDEVAHIFGVEPSSLTNGRQAYAFYAEADQPLIRQAVQDAIRLAVPYDLELEVRTATGERKWVRTIGAPLVEDGVVVRIHGSLQDITDRKRIESRLATQNAVSRILAEAASVETAVPPLLEALCQADRWDGGILFIADGATDRLRPIGAWARPGTVGTSLIDGVRRFTFARGEGLLGEVWATRTAAMRPVGELLSVPRYTLASLTLEVGYRTVLACPLVAGEHVLALGCFLSLEEKPYDEELRRSCHAIGQQFGLFLQRKQAEAALVQSELRYRTLVAEASDGIFLIGPDRLYQEVNPRYVEMLGYERDEVIGSRIGDFLVEEQRATVDETLAILERLGSRVIEVQVRRRDGTVIELEMNGRLLPDGSIIAIVRDITQRKRAEADVQRRLELEARLSQLATTAPGVMYSFRLREDGTPCFPYASAPIEELTGYSAAQLRDSAEAAFSRIPAADRDAMQRSIEESARTMGAWSMTFRQDHPLKGLRWLDARSAPVREADGTVTWHGFMADVTERRELEEQLRQAQKMEAIGQLASGVAHDFNNLLTVIQGNASLLADGLGGGESAQEIMQAAERAAALTRQLLLFSRKQEMHATALDLNEIVANMTKLLRRILGEDIVLRAEFSPRPTIIHADAGMIEQILLNLAVNSRDAMPSGGRLTISTSLEETMAPEAEGSGLIARLQVVDTGCGIAADVLPRIFEPFFTTKDVGKGTGLGLATVYAIVRQHGGTVNVDSTPGQGTTFDISFPALSPSARDAARAKGRSEVPRGSETILLVEDEPSVRQLVQHLLTRSGYTVIAAESGRKALALFAEQASAIDLLLTDMVMPDGVSGRQLAQRLTELQPGLKVIYTSGYTANATAPDVELIPGENFIGKPYQPADLARIVRTALDK